MLARFDVGAAVDQHTRQLVVAVVGRRQQRRPAVLGGLVDVGAGVEQSFADSRSPSRAAKTSAVKAAAAGAHEPGDDDFGVVSRLGRRLGAAAAPRRARIRRRRRRWLGRRRTREVRSASVEDTAEAQKLSKDAERRIAKLRREFREQFDSTVVAHTTGADEGDPNAQPQLVKHVSEGDTVKLKSMGRPAVVKRRIDDNNFEVEIGAMKMKVPRDDIAEVLVKLG